MTVATDAPEATVVTEPGVYDLDIDTYHADPVPAGSLSASGARLLLPPSTPAHYRHERDHGRAPKREWDLGHAAHTLVLGVGPDIAPVDAPDWRTKAAKEQAAEAREAGAVPLLRHEFDQMQAMADALRQHPVAGPLADPGNVHVEQSLFWQDEPTGVWRRSRPDILPRRLSSRGRLVLADYKTAISADTESVEKAMHRYGYYIQAANAVAGAQALGLADTVAYLLIVQERTPPHLVHVVEPDAGALRAGAIDMRRALEIYARCAEENVWPGYETEIEQVGLPTWAAREYEQETW